MTLGGIAAGDRWVDASGAVHVVTWVRKIGVVGYRPVVGHSGTELVMDVVRFVRTFAPLKESTTDRAA